MQGRDPDPRANDRTVAALRDCLGPRDAAVVLSVPVVLVAVFALPDAAKSSLTLAYREPTPLAAYASHFVHLDAGHLATNLLAYLAVVPAALALAALGGRRTRFYAAFATVLLAFPAALSALNLALPRPSVGYGFSGVNMALLGLLVHALGWYHRANAPDAGADRAPALFFAGTAVVSVRAVPASPPALLAGAGSVLAAALYLRTALLAGPRRWLAAAGRAAREWPAFELAVVAVLLVLALPVVAFPRDPTAGDGVVNVYTHLLGFCLGYVVPYAAFRVVGVDVGGTGRPDRLR